MEKLPAITTAARKRNMWNETDAQETEETIDRDGGDDWEEDDESFDFSAQGTCGLDWVKSFLELEEDKT